MNRLARRALPALALACLGCSIGAVQGRVVDMQDEALPGVAVNVVGTSYQDVTNSLGEYRVRYEPGEVRLRFSKTGHTPAVFETRSTSRMPIYAETVRMWHLPPNRGVYLYARNQYHDTDPTEPVAYGGVHGTEKWVDIEAEGASPRLIAYKMPLGGALLSRLQLVEASRTTAEGETGEDVEIWAAASTTPLVSRPLDQPDRLLQALEYGEPLEPGIYAVHWGALDGNTNPEPRMYMFTVQEQVIEPEAPAETEEEG